MANEKIRVNLDVPGEVVAYIEAEISDDSIVIRSFPHGLVICPDASNSAIVKMAR